MGMGIRKKGDAVFIHLERAAAVYDIHIIYFLQRPPWIWDLLLLDYWFALSRGSGEGSGVSMFISGRNKSVGFLST